MVATAADCRSTIESPYADWSVASFAPFYSNGPRMAQKNQRNWPESAIMPLFDTPGAMGMATATARHILVDTEDQCQSLKDEIAGGADFADLAKKHSSCPSGQKGGDLGEFSPGMMVPEFDKVVFSADVNSVEGPVKTQFGYHLLEVTGRTD